MIGKGLLEGSLVLAISAARLCRIVILVVLHILVFFERVVAYHGVIIELTDVGNAGVRRRDIAALIKLLSD